MNRKIVYVTLSQFCDSDDSPRRLLQNAGFEVRENRTGRRITREELPSALARISHEWCPKLHLGEGKGVGSWVAGAKMPTERGNWAWMTGVEGNGDVKSDYRDSYPEQRREGWDV